MGLTSKIISFIRDVVVDIAAAFISGFILYYYFGGKIEDFLVKIYPDLPRLFYSSIIVAFIGALFYKFIKSIRYRRNLERTFFDIHSFLRDWDALREAFHKAVQNRSDVDLNEFEAIRTRLLFNYPKISSIASTMRYEIIDRVRGVHLRNYDVIGNLLAQSPFSGTQWFQIGYKSREFVEAWDRGRTILVAILVRLDIQWNSVWHRLLQIIRLVPNLFPLDNGANEKTAS